MFRRTWGGLAAVAAAAAALAAPASASFGDVTVSAQTRVNLEAFGDGVPAGFEEFWNQTVDGTATGVASSSYDWPAPSPMLPGGSTGCPDTGCATKEARAHASVDRAAGTLRAAAVARIGTGGFLADNAGYNQTFARAEIEDTLTLSQAATVVLEGSIAGQLGLRNSHDGWYGDPRARLEADISFSVDDPSGGEWPYRWLGGLQEEYVAEPIFSCPYPATCAVDDSIPMLPQGVSETFSIPVELPAGTSFFRASLIADVDMLVWGAEGDLYRSMHVMSALVNFANTATFRILVPDGVAAQSGSGQLPLVGGLAETPDTTPPTVTAPADVTVPNAPGRADADVDPGLASAADDSGAATVEGARSDGRALDAPYPIGVTTITWTATDAAGNTATATQTVTVQDVEDPVPALPAAVTVDATGPAGAVVTYAASATDNSGSATVVCAPASGSTFPIGVTTVTCTATDAAGNDAAGTFAVTVRGAADQLDDLIAFVAQQSLKAKAEAASASLAKGNSTPACNQLGALLNQVDALEGTKLTAAEAAEIRERAARIMAVAGCS